MRLSKFVLAPTALALLSALAAPAALAGPVVNGSFEAPTASGTLGDRKYCYLGSTNSTQGCTTVGLTAASFGWTGNAPVMQANSTSWNRPDTLGAYAFGNQLVGIQDVTFIEQVLALTEGSYTLSWADAGRRNYAAARYDVRIDGDVLGTFSTVAADSWVVNALKFSASGPVTLRFQGLAVAGDGTAFIDGITLTQNVPEPSALALSALALAGLTVLRRRRA